MQPVLTAAGGQELKAGSNSSGRTGLTYLLVILGSILAMVLIVALFWTQLIGIGLDGTGSWYRDYGGRSFPEISDQDLFYQNLGPSVSHAKAADIVILGPSFSAYAFDRDVLRRFGSDAGLKIFNMSFIGIRGGEFSRRVIERWGIHAPLWVINVDDQFIHFFSSSTDLTLGPKTEPILALDLDRFHGFVRVARRTLLWRYEDWQAKRRTGQDGPIGLYRNVTNGNVLLDVNPRYVADDNKPLAIGRDPDCHVTQDVIDAGRKYLKSIGGQVILTLVPHSQYCPTQAHELAKALGVELILVPPAGLTTVDGGGHLDKRSATIFTNDFMSHLVRTDAFKQAFGDRGIGKAGADTTTSLDSPKP